MVNTDLGGLRATTPEMVFTAYSAFPRGEDKVVEKKDQDVDLALSFVHLSMLLKH